MAADLVKIRTKIFWGQRILGSKDFGVRGFWGIIWFSGGTVGGVSHRQQSVGLFRLTSFSNSRKRRHQKSVQELHLSLWDSVSPLIVQAWVHALYRLASYGKDDRRRVNIFLESSPKQSHKTFEINNKVPNNNLLDLDTLIP